MKTQNKYTTTFEINGVEHEERIVAQSKSEAIEKTKLFFNNPKNIIITEV